LKWIKAAEPGSPQHQSRKSFAQSSSGRGTGPDDGDNVMIASPEVKARARDALGQVTTLRRQIAGDGRKLYRTWRKRIARRSFAPSALNFAHYLALRRHDLRPLQRKLMGLGISSLGRLESRVLVSLDAVIVALASLAGEQACRYRSPSEAHFFRGEARLADCVGEIFGPPRRGRVGRIMVTLPTEAADDPALIRTYTEHGADVMRINCAHDGAREWTRMVANIRAAEDKAKRRFPILMDIGGPKVRTEAVLTPPDRSRAHIGDLILLAREIRPPLAEVPFQATCSEPGVLDSIRMDDEVSLDDGQLQGMIVGEAHGGFLIRIARGKLAGVKLVPGKGLNFPMSELKLDPLTDKDRDDLDFIVGHADMIGYSFVQTADHVAMLQGELAQRRADWRALGLVGKLETPRAVRNLPEIMVQAAGNQPFAVMIARGDLAVEMGFERVAEMQEELLWLAEAGHVPVIWATQVLEDLVKKGLASRGEMTDAAMAGRAECVMLNKGPNVAEAIDVLDHLLHRMGEHQVKKTPTLRALHSWPAQAEQSLARP
jgi:pyruvate kinase